MLYSAPRILVFISKVPLYTVSMLPMNTELDSLSLAVPSEVVILPDIIDEEVPDFTIVTRTTPSDSSTSYPSGLIETSTASILKTAYKIRLLISFLNLPLSLSMITAVASLLTMLTLLSVVVRRPENSSGFSNTVSFMINTEIL